MASNVSIALPTSSGISPRSISRGTMLLTAGVGVTLERIAYRPLRRKGAHRLYVVITALMCGLILENGNLALLGASRRKLPDMVDKVVYTFGSVSVTNLKVWVIITAFLVFFLLQTSIKSNGGKGKMDPAIWMWAINLLYFALAVLLNLWDTVPMRRFRARFNKGAA